jgi:hypothetical protein
MSLCLQGSQQVIDPNAFQPTSAAGAAAPLSSLDESALVVVDSIAPWSSSVGPLGESPKQAEAAAYVSLMQASWNAFYLGCTCGTTYANNCAHFLTNAMLIATSTTGFSWPQPFPASAAKCPAGRLIRAKEALAWFRSFAPWFSSNHNTISQYHWFVYQERRSDGQGHVCFHLETPSSYWWKGTGNFSGQWEVDWHFLY